MEIVLMLLAALSMPALMGGGSDADDTSDPNTGDTDTGGTDTGGTDTGGTDTASAIAADPTAPELNAATDASGNTIIQANGAGNALTDVTILDFALSDPTISALPAGSVAFDAGAGDDSLNLRALDLPSVSGGAGDDAISSQDSDITIEGNEGDDRISSEAGANVTLDGGEGDDRISFSFGSTPSSEGESADLNTGATLTGGAGEDEFIISADVADVPLTATGNALFATITDFNAAVDMFSISLDSDDGPNTNVNFVSSVAGPDIPYLDLNFTITGEPVDGVTPERTLTIRIEENVTDIAFDMLEIFERRTGVAISLGVG